MCILESYVGYMENIGLLMQNMGIELLIHMTIILTIFRSYKIECSFFF